MTEDVKIRVIGDADQLVAEMGQATRALRGMSATAQKTATATSASLRSIEFQVVARNIADVAQKFGQMAAATYEMATAWRDARKEIGANAGLDSLISGVDEAEESVRRIRDSFGALAASMLQEFAPALDVAAGKIRDFTVGAAFVIERVSLALTYLTQGEEAAFRQWTEHQGQLEALSVSLLQSSESQIEAQERAATVEDRRVKIAQEIGAAQRQLLNIADQAASDQLSDQERIVAAYRDQLDVIGDVAAAALALAETESAIASTRQAATLARTEAEARQLRDLAALDLQLAEERDAAQTARAAETANRRRASDAIVLSSAMETADTLAGLVKKGSKEAAAAQKAAALFAVTINTIQGASKAIAELGPFGIPAAAAIGVLGAAQAAAIASAPMPSFDRGGVVDGGPQYPGGRPGQRLAQVEDGEFVLTRKMQEAMGGREQTVILKVGSREFGRAVIASGATDGLQRRRGVGQRRYGG